MNPRTRNLSFFMRHVVLAGALLGIVASSETLTAQSLVPTFSKDIAPIVFAHCAGCHRPDGGAPFSLLSYEDVRRRADVIAKATRSRQMPPWKPEPGFGDFAGERRLTEDQLALIQRWVEGGGQEGDPADLPPIPPPPGEWQLGKPDLIVTMPEPYRLAADGAEVFRTFVVPIPTAVARYVKGLEVNPGASPVMHHALDHGEPGAGAVHHATIRIDRTRSSRMLDDEEPGPGYDGGGGRSAAFPSGQFLGWTPGRVPSMQPDGMSWQLQPNSDLVLELHLMPTGRPENVQVKVGLFFTDQAPTRYVSILRLGSQSIDIAAGETSVVADSFTIPVDADIVAVHPHAHNLATQIEGYAQLPDGTTKWLLYIKEWDFGWLDVYRYRSPLHLPKGTTLWMRYTYDNSAANLRNPNRPPRRVTYGQTTSSEMGNLWIQVVTRNQDDLAALDEAYVPKMILGDIAGYEKMLEITPEDARLHTDIAFRYLDAGREPDAVAHLDEAVRLSPTSPSAHYALGTLLLNQRRLGEAEEQFNVAVRLKPDFSAAYNNLGVVRYAQGRFADAVSSYERAVQLEPDNRQAHYNLGRALAALGKSDEAISEYRLVLQFTPEDPDALSSLGSVLASTGQVGEAVAQYRRALALKPDLQAALVDLAWILATSDRAEIRAPEEAVHLAERVADLTGHQNATVLETLALAYFSANRIDEAVRAAEQALNLATRAGADELARAIRARLDSYRQHLK